MSTRTMRHSSVIAFFVAVALPLTVIPSASGRSNHIEPSVTYDPHHLLVSFQDGTRGPQRVAIHESVGASRVMSLPNLGIDVVALPHAVAPHDARSTYLSIPGVRNAELNTYGSPLAVSKPDDPEFVNQWYLHNEGQNVSGGILGGSPDLVDPEPDFDIDAPEAWRFAAKRPGSPSPVRVAILDSGIDATHPDLQGSVVACATAISGTGLVTEGYCLDDHGHGTHLAGIVAARRGNGIGVAGIAPEAGLAVFKLMDTNGRISRADFLAGIEWAMDPLRGDADILSMSFAMPECARVDTDEIALDKAHEAGLLLVAAAGNKTCPLSYRAESVINPNAEGDDPVYPSAYANVLSVTGTIGHGRFWSRATCNNTVDMAAPAQTIWSTVAGFLGGGYTPANGTSLAAEEVAAAAAVLKGEWDLSNDQLRERLLESVTAVQPDSARPSTCSHVGQLNLRDALTGSKAG
jgi:subtilisin family serine protease